MSARYDFASDNTAAATPDETAATVRKRFPQVF